MKSSYFLKESNDKKLGLERASDRENKVAILFSSFELGESGFIIGPL